MKKTRDKNLRRIRFPAISRFALRKSVQNMDKHSGYRFLAADGSTFTYFSKPSLSPPEYFVSEGHSAKGFFSMHLNSLYDLQKHTYSDALIQPVHQKDEFRAGQYFLFRTKDIHSKGLVNRVVRICSG